jgi:hypothetical protein
MMSDEDDVEYEYVDDGNQVSQWNGGISPVPVSSSSLFSVMEKVFDFAKEKEITKREIARYHDMRDIAIKEITERYKVINKSLDNQRFYIEKEFKLIDKGLEQGNHELVNKALENITEIVKVSPLDMFKTMTQQQQRNWLNED